MSRARDLADSADLNFDSGTLVIDSANNRVGIGKTPGELLDVNGQARATQFMLSSSTSVPSVGAALYRPAADTIGFVTNSSEKMRIDSSGHVLVNTTDNSPENNSTGTSADNGIALAPYGYGAFSRYAANSGTGIPLFVNRTNADGDLIQFRKNGSTVGAIGVVNTSEPYFADSSSTYDAGIRLKAHATYNMVAPCDNVGAFTDGALDFGYSGARFRNLYLSGGVYLGGTGAANKLEDYETGTWTPVVSTDGTSTGIASISNAEYIKIGSVVHLHCQINLNSSGRLTSGTDISGQPFAASRFGGGTYSGASSTSYGGIAVVFTSVFKLREDLKTSNAGNWYVTITYHTTA